MTDVSEHQLLERYREGDTQAFAELVRRHQGPLLRHARALVGAGSSYEDVVQEAFLKLAWSPPELRAVPETDGRQHAQLSSWLHKVTRNLCMDVMRSEARRKRREEAVAAQEASAGGLDTVEAADTRAAVEVTLARLPVDQREVLVLRLLGEKSYREIAEVTGKKVGTVGWLVSVGLKALSEELMPLLEGRSSRSVNETREPGMGFGMVQGEPS